MYGDMLLLLKNQTMPYEKEPGQTRSLEEKWVKDLTGQFRKKQGLTGASMHRNLDAMVRDFAAIPLEKKALSKVGIVGEIYVKYSALGNNDLEALLHALGCEVMVPGVLGFFQYCFANADVDHAYYGGSGIRLAACRAALKIANGWEETL